jgi:hypothetical protein
VNLKGFLVIFERESVLLLFILSDN